MTYCKDDPTIGVVKCEGERVSRTLREQEEHFWGILRTKATAVAIVESPVAFAVYLSILASTLTSETPN